MRDELSSFLDLAVRVVTTVPRHEISAASLRLKSGFPFPGIPRRGIAGVRARGAQCRHASASMPAPGSSARATSARDPSSTG